MFLYRYLSSQHAILSLESKRLKIGRLHELNDPFDCFPCVRNIPIPGEGLDFGFAKGMLEVWTKQLGVLCFSKKIDDPVLWSHYADAHRGIAFAFKLPDNLLHKITYSDLRPQLDYLRDFDTSSPDGAHKSINNIIANAFTVKASSWSYEEEYRQFILFDGCMMSNGMYFTDNPFEYLSQIIIGARSTVEAEYFARILPTLGFDNITIIKARQSYDSYKIQVEQGA